MNTDIANRVLDLKQVIEANSRDGIFLDPELCVFFSEALSDIHETLQALTIYGLAHGLGEELAARQERAESALTEAARLRDTPFARSSRRRARALAAAEIPGSNIVAMPEAFAPRTVPCHGRSGDVA